MKKNDILTLEIVALGADCAGIARVDGLAVFVQGALPNETVCAVIIKITASYAVGKLLEVITPCAIRQTPNCGVYSQCGGCSLLHMQYEATLQYKTQQVYDCLRRIAHIDAPIPLCVGMQHPFGYRNKSSYPVGNGVNGPTAGFFAPHSHRLISAENCLMQPQASADIVQITLQWMRENNIPAYDETTHTGIVRHISTRTTGQGSMAVLSMRAMPNALPKWTQMLQLAGVQCAAISVLPQRTNVILGSDTRYLYGNGIYEELCNLRFKISPQSFFQVNTQQAQVLYNLVSDYAALTGQETVLDLYCGTGTIGLVLAQNAKYVYGAEIVPEAVADAQENAVINHIQNAEFIVADAAQATSTLLARGIAADCIVLDPPRKGCDLSLIDVVVQANPNRIVYVSCNPATLARDIALFAQRGYQLDINRIQPLDMFPWTAHVETVVLMSRI